jgi:hypothetical protein
VPTQYQATKAETAHRYFDCSLCGAKGEVVFRAEGESSWHKDRWLDDEGAAMLRAADAAADDLFTDAERVQHLIPCPTCKRRHPGYVRWAYIRVVGWLAIGGGILAVAGTQMAIGAAFFGVLGGLQAWRERSRFKRADRAMLLRLTPGKRPEMEPPPPAKPVHVQRPAIPVARALVAPPIQPIAPRGPDEEPAFLRKKSD